MSKIGSQEFQEHSEVDLFNKIGFIAETLGYHPVYFKVLKPMLMETENDFKMGAKLSESQQFKQKERESGEVLQIRRGIDDFFTYCNWGRKKTPGAPFPERRANQVTRSGGAQAP